MLSRYVLALQFLTRIPLPYQPAYSPERMAQAAAYFPLVGATVGLLLWAIHAVGIRAWPAAVVVVVVVIAEAVITGAFHLDGLADTCDGIFSGRDRERMLEIMRDSRIGTFGALALIADVAVKATALWSLPDDVRGPVLVVFPTVARVGLVPLMALFPYARRTAGLGAAHAGKVGWIEFVVGLVTACAVAMGLLGPAEGGLAVALALFTALLGGSFIAQRLGGLTGDTYGAMEEVSALALLLAAAAWWGHP